MAFKRNVIVRSNSKVNKNTLGAKKWCGQEKQRLKGVI